MRSALLGLAFALLLALVFSPVTPPVLLGGTDVMVLDTGPPDAVLADMATDFLAFNSNVVITPGVTSFNNYVNRYAKAEAPLDALGVVDSRSKRSRGNRSTFDAFYLRT